jgi:hypothetical protein
MAKPPSPSPLFPPIFAAIAAIVGALLIGFLIGRFTSPDAPSTLDSAAAERSQHASGPIAKAGTDETSETTRSSTREAWDGKREEAFEHRGDAVSQLREGKQTGSEISRVIRLFGILSRISEEEIPSVLAYANGLAGDQRQEREMILFGALSRWAQFDPAAAAEWTRSQAGTNLKGKDDELPRDGPVEWAVRDGAAARAWIDQLTDSSQRVGALRGYLAALAMRDPTLRCRNCRVCRGSSR